jgi:hypothetical protein
MRMLVSVVAGISVAALAGCGGSSHARPAPHAVRGDTAARAALERRMGAVVRAWSARLNAGDNRGVAELFSLPAVMTQGSSSYRLHTIRQLVIWHRALPCAGRVVSIRFAGRFATATFRLGNRPGSTCDAPGGLAAARFEIVGGKIVSWEQVPVPGETGGPVA